MKRNEISARMDSYEKPWWPKENGAIITKAEFCSYWNVLQNEGRGRHLRKKNEVNGRTRYWGNSSVIDAWEKQWLKGTESFRSEGRKQELCKYPNYLSSGAEMLGGWKQNRNSAVLVSSLRLWSKHQAKAAEGRWGPFPLAVWRGSLPWLRAWRQEYEATGQARLHPESGEKQTRVLRSLCLFYSVWQWCPHSGCIFPLWLKFVGHSLVDTPEVFPTWFSI